MPLRTARNTSRGCDTLLSIVPLDKIPPPLMFETPLSVFVHHGEVFARDDLSEYIDAAVYTSEIPVAKPHADAFRQILDALDVHPDEAVYVGDRLWDDIHGAQQVGMRAIWIPHSAIPDQQLPDGGLPEVQERESSVPPTKPAEPPFADPGGDHRWTIRGCHGGSIAVRRDRSCPERTKTRPSGRVLVVSEGGLEPPPPCGD